MLVRSNVLVCENVLYLNKLRRFSLAIWVLDVILLVSDRFVISVNKLLSLKEVLI